MESLLIIMFSAYEDLYLYRRNLNYVIIAVYYFFI